MAARRDERITCRECGQRFTFLPPHLARAHELTAEAYRTRYQIPASEPLASADYVERASARARRQWQEHGPTFDQRDGVEAARHVGRGTRTARDRERQQHIMQENAPRVQNRDATHTRKRLYLRAWRALQAGDPGPMQTYRERYTR